MTQRTIDQDTLEAVVKSGQALYSSSMEDGKLLQIFRPLEPECYIIAFTYWVKDGDETIRRMLTKVLGDEEINEMIHVIELPGIEFYSRASEDYEADEKR